MLTVKLLVAGNKDSMSTRFNYSMADTDSIVNDLGLVDWETEVQSKSAEETLIVIKYKIFAATEKFVPKTIGAGKLRKIWMDKRYS